MPLLLALLLLVAPALGAQQTAARPLSALRAGDTVRVWASSPAEQVGALAAPVADSLAIVRRDGRTVAYPVTMLSRVDVQRGTRRSTGRIILGVIGGAALGTVLGATAGAAIGESSDCTGDLCGLAGFAVGGLVGGVGGGIVGGVVGARWRARRWEPVYP